jgi:phage-related baseplate assembly protein
VDRAQSSQKEPELLQIVCLVALTDAQDAPRAAYRSARRAVDLAESIAKPRWQAVTQVRLGRTALQRGKKAEAEAALRLALDSGELLGEPALRLEAMGLLAGILEARGETEEAAALREEESALRAWLDGE